MRTLDELEGFVLAWSEGVIKRIVEANENVGETLRNNIQADAPIRTGLYVESITLGPTIVEKHSVITEVYTAQTLGERGSTNPRWVNVPLGALLEWGTGPEGASTGEAEEYGYSYTMDWRGMVARPHFKPNLYRIKPLYKEKLREAVKLSWKRRG